MSEKAKRKYLFLTGGAHGSHKEVEHDSDAQAVEAAKKDKGVIRVQCLTTFKHIHEAVADAKQAVAILLLSCLLALCTTAHAATSIGVLPAGAAAVIDSTQGTSTNQLLSTTNTVKWPTVITGKGAGTSVTNVTAIPVTAGTHLVIETDVQLNVAAAASVTNVIFHIGRNVNGGQPTNSLGTGLKIDWFATITNQLPASAAANTTFTKCVTFGPQTGYSDGAFEGGCTTFYIGWIDPPANLEVTNMQVYVNNQ